jgi:oligopeptide/dipeptide ABC transporter ATP-binding protein
MDEKASNHTLLRVEDLKTYFFTQKGKRVVKAVDGVNFSLAEGEILGLVGESGCGKTVTTLSILRLLPAAARIVGGRIILGGEDLLEKNEREMRRVRGKKVSMILQDPMVSLNPLYTIGDQIAEPLKLHKKLAGTELLDRVRALLKAVKISSPETRRKEYPHQMSGGMRQRIVGSIAISCEPSLIIADEATTNLDLTIQAQYLKLLKEIQQRNRLSMIFITHNFGIVARMCDHVAVMYAGKIMEKAPVREIFNSPAHPYTEALLGAVPSVDYHEDRLLTIEGQPPDLAALPSGCSFHPRCGKAVERCRVEAPPEFKLAEEHYSRCWLCEN